MNHPQVAAFARLAEENAVPTRVIEGVASRLGRTMHDVMFDAIHDELVVTSPFAQAILTFRGDADGEEAPLRIIQGPNTQIVSERGLDKVTIDPVNNEILIATNHGDDRDPLGAILVFPREADGDVAPIRVLSGPATQFGGGRPSMRVDNKNDLLLVAESGGILIFDRTASGNTPPVGWIPGPSGNQFDVYNDLIITLRGDYLYAWDIHTRGEGIRPVWKISTPLGARAAQTGLVLDPVHEEVIVATGAGNQILVFHVPEIFAERSEVPRASTPFRFSAEE